VDFLSKLPELLVVRASLDHPKEPPFLVGDVIAEQLAEGVERAPTTIGRAAA
jgi:hypothetical protein